MVKNHLLATYLLFVGLPVLGLLGILEAGRGIPAPLAIGGDWTVEFDPAAHCLSGPSSLRQPAWTISQSGAQASITLNDRRATTFDASINGANLIAKPLTATISGKSSARALQGQMQFEGCSPVSFRAVRQAARKAGE